MRTVDRTIILMISKVVASLNILVLSILFARILSKAEYGTYIQVNMLVQPLALILALGLPASLNYFLPKNINRKLLLFRTFAVVLIVGSCGWMTMVYFKAEIVYFLNNGDLERFVPLAGACVFSSVCFQLISPILLYRNAGVTLAIINICRAVMFFGSITLALLIKRSIDVVLIVFTINYLIDFFIALVVTFRDANRYYDDNVKENLPGKDQMTYAIPLSLSAIFWLAGREIDKYIISHYMTPDELAVYARGAFELPLVHILASTIAQVHLPKWVGIWDSGHYQQFLEGWHTTIIKTALIMFPIFVLFEIIGKDFIVLLYSIEYQGSVIIFIIYLLLVPLQITSYTAVIQSTGNNRFILYGYIGQILFNVIFSVYFIRFFGRIAPAIVTVSSMYLWTFYMLYMISKVFKVPFGNIFPWQRLRKILAASMAAGIIPVLLMLAFNSGAINFNMLHMNIETVNFLRIATLTFVYLLVVMTVFNRFNIFDSEDKAVIHRWLMINKIRSLF